MVISVLCLLLQAHGCASWHFCCTWQLPIKLDKYACLQGCSIICLSHETGQVINKTACLQCTAWNYCRRRADTRRRAPSPPWADTRAQRCVLLWKLDAIARRLLRFIEERLLNCLHNANQGPRPRMTQTVQRLGRRQHEQKEERPLDPWRCKSARGRPLCMLLKNEL